MRIADTSFLHALSAERDDFHGRALADLAVPDAVLIPPEILSETPALVQYRRGFPTALAAGRWLREQGRLHIGEEWLVEESWRAFESAKGALTHPDAVVVAWCRHLRADPLSYGDDILGSV